MTRYEQSVEYSAVHGARYGLGESDYGPHTSRSMLGSWSLGAVLIMVGTLLLVIVDGGLGPAIFALLFFGAGIAIHQIPGVRDRYALRAYMLTYSTCVLVAGLAQSYAVLMFDTVQTTVDAETFYDLTHQGLRFLALEGHVGQRSISPLPMLLWEALYSASAGIGLGDGPWVGVLFNCLIVGMAGSIAVRAGRYVCGDDDRRLRRLGSLFASCGLMWLFGALFLRDCFAMILNMLVLWACVRALATPGATKVVFAVVTLLLSALCMNYVRSDVSPIFVVIGVLAVVSWRIGLGSAGVTIILLLVGMACGLLLLPLILPYVGGVALSVEESALSYGAGADVAGSLGSSLVVRQPPPIRLVAGSLYLLSQPVPLWNNFRIGMREYHWIKGWEGIFLVWIVPSACVGFMTAVRRVIRKESGASSASFVALYALVTLMAVAMTSLETRHHGQFLPSILLLAAMPDRHHPPTRHKIGRVAIVWFTLIVAGHILWAAMKLF